MFIFGAAEELLPTIGISFLKWEKRPVSQQLEKAMVCGEVKGFITSNWNNDISIGSRAFFFRNR